MKIECHHIVKESESKDNSIDNCIPLCFDCHADMSSYDPTHPKGTTYRSDELKRHRDNWYTKIASAPSPQYTEKHENLDRELFQRIISILPWHGSMSFIDTNNFAGFSFDTSMLNQLRNFDAIGEDPSCEFIDPTLDSLRVELKSHVETFLIAIAKYTFPRDNARNSIPMDWELENPKVFKEAVEAIHKHSQNAVTTYKSLIREGRHRLAVATPLK